MNPIESIDIAEYIEIASSLSYVNLDYIKKYTSEYNIENMLIELVRHYLVDLSVCHSLLYYLRCCELICRISDSQIVIEEFYRKIFETATSFPHECTGLLNILFRSACMYMSLPEDIATISTKKNILLGIKANEATKCLYLDVLEYVLDEKLISDYSMLNDDIEYIRAQQEKVDYGYKMYCDGKHRKAEQIFTESLNCNISSVADLARTNLGYMVRRNEANPELNFEEIMQPKKMLTGFDIINLLLFYSSKKQFENEGYQKAIARLETLSEKEKSNIIEWWSNIDMVGEEESRQALSFLKSE